MKEDSKMKYEPTLEETLAVFEELTAANKGSLLIVTDGEDKELSWLATKYLVVMVDKGVLSITLKSGGPKIELWINADVAKAALDQAYKESE